MFKVVFFLCLTYFKSTGFIQWSSVGLCDALYQLFAPASAVGEGLAGLECAETVGVVSKLKKKKKKKKKSHQGTMCSIQRNLTLVMFPSVQTCHEDLFKLPRSPCNLIVIEGICYWVNVILPG